MPGRRRERPPRHGCRSACRALPGRSWNHSRKSSTCCWRPTSRLRSAIGGERSWLQHGSAGDLPGAQLRKDLIGLPQRKRARMRPDAGLRRDLEEFDPVAARQGWRPKAAAAPPRGCCKGTMEYPTCECRRRPRARPCARRASASGTRAPTGAIDDRGIERHRRRLILGCPGPIRAERACKALRLDIALAREGINRAPLPARHLRDDMSGRTEAKDAEMLSIPAMTSERQPIRPAQSRGAMRDIVAGFAERKAIAGVRDEMRGKAAVARVAGEARAVAEVFPAAPAIGTFAAGIAEPGNADPLAEPEERSHRAQARPPGRPPHGRGRSDRRCQVILHRRHADRSGTRRRRSP